MADRETEKYYHRRAAEYEQIYHRNNPDRRKELADEVGRLRDLATDQRVLEIACGTGYWTKVMAATAKAIDAIDLAPEMIREAEGKAYGCPVAFSVADMNAMKVDPGKYDLVALGFWFSHHPRQQYDQLFDLLTRPLRKDGRIWMIDNNPPAEGPQQHHVRYDRHGNNYKHRFLDNGERHTILKNYFDREALEAVLAPRFEIESLIHQTYYWSVVLAPHSG